MMGQVGQGPSGVVSISAAINGARRRGAAVRSARRHRATGWVGQGPSGAASIPGAWSAWAHRDLRLLRVKEARQGGP